MTNFNFYKADKAYGELYLQFPKVFLYSDKYKGLSNDAKIAYMVFKDRLQYSIHNNWIDEENNVYFVYTNKELGQLLNCSEHKVIKTKKELENINLLLQIKQGFNAKKKRNEPNRLYLADLQVEAHEVYAFQNIQKQGETPSIQGTAKNAVRQKQEETPSVQGTAKNAVRQKAEQTPPVQGTAKNAVNQYKESLKDSKDNKESQYDLQKLLIENSLEENQNQETNQEEIEVYIQEHSLIDFFGEDVINRMTTFSNSNFELFKIFADKLIYSLKSVEKEKEKTYSTIDIQQLHNQLLRTFIKVFQEYKKGKVKNLNSYLFSSFKNDFIDFANSKDNIIEQSNNEPVPTIDFINNKN